MPVMRQVERMLFPSTKADTTWTRCAVLRRLIMSKYYA